jgi:hypothetical protein
MRAFLVSEAGAVTVDWTILTASLVGLGLATVGTVSSGLQNASEDVSARLVSTSIMDRFDAVLAADDFENGRGDWIGGAIRNVAGFGNVLALSRNARSASLPIEVDPSHNFAVVEFDMIVADSWDNEAGSIIIGDAEVVGVQHWWQDPNGPDVRTFEGTDTVVTLTRTSSDSGTWGGNGRTAHDDYTYRVSVVTANDGSDLTLNASTTLDQGDGDEFFGIDNVTVTGSDRGR